MSPELDKKLCEKYPKIFSQRGGDPTETLMCWGFAHGDGWFNIIDAMCSNIQSHIDWNEKNIAHALKFNEIKRHMHDGEFGLFDSYFTGDPLFKERRRNEILSGSYRKVPDACAQVVAVQVKEKFGTLRFYYDGGDDYIRGIVSMAESMSAVTCEECGVPGKQRGGGWIQTLCDAHAEAAGKFAEEEM